MTPSERSRPPIPSAVRTRRDLQDHEAVTRLNFSWIVQLRWTAAVGQVITIAVVHGGMGIRLPITPLCLLIAAGALSNLLCALWLKRAPPLATWMLGTLMALDLCLFTGVLYFTGGPFNPFSSLYLVHLALAAIVLPPRWTWTLVALAVLGNAGLFYDHVPLPIDHGADPAMHAGHHGMHGDGPEPLSLHLRGMWVAFGVTAGFIVYFLYRVNRALAEREEQLAKIRDRAERSARLASVATLAAGAAHELATPLSTIAVVAKELERTHGTECAEDLQLIRREVDRCRDILGQMAGDAGESPGETAASARVEDVVREAMSGLADASRIDTVWSEGARDAEVVVPLRAVAQALRNVLKNGLDASPPEGRVTLRVERGGAWWQFIVIDRGQGMSPEVVAHATEPFFTTKETGQGMGLGLFLAKSVFDFLGGALEIVSSTPEGTSVALRLPATIGRTPAGASARTL